MNKNPEIIPDPRDYVPASFGPAVWREGKPEPEPMTEAWTNGHILIGRRPPYVPSKPRESCPTTNSNGYNMFRPDQILRVRGWYNKQPAPGYVVNYQQDRELQYKGITHAKHGVVALRFETEDGLPTSINGDYYALFAGMYGTDIRLFTSHRFPLNDAYAPVGVFSKSGKKQLGFIMPLALSEVGNDEG